MRVILISQILMLDIKNNGYPDISCFKTFFKCFQNSKLGKKNPFNTF